MPHPQLPNCESSYRRLLMTHAEARPGPRPRRRETGPALPGAPRRRPVSASSGTSQGVLDVRSEAPLWCVTPTLAPGLPSPVSRSEPAQSPEPKRRLNWPDACWDRGTRAGSGRASDSPARACTYGDRTGREALGAPWRGWVGFFETGADSSFLGGQPSICSLSER